MTLQDYLGRITKPLLACKSCLKDENNQRCPEYNPCASLELIEVEPNIDIYGDNGMVKINKGDNNGCP